MHCGTSASSRANDRPRHPARRALPLLVAMLNSFVINYTILLVFGKTVEARSLRGGVEFGDSPIGSGEGFASQAMCCEEQPEGG